MRRLCDIRGERLGRSWLKRSEPEMGMVTPERRATVPPVVRVGAVWREWGDGTKEPPGQAAGTWRLAGG